MSDYLVRSVVRGLGNPRPPRAQSASANTGAAPLAKAIGYSRLMLWYYEAGECQIPENVATCVRSSPTLVRSDRSCVVRSGGLRPICFQGVPTG